MANSGLVQRVGAEERPSFLFTLKLFPTQWGDGAALRVAVERSEWGGGGEGGLVHHEAWLVCAD